MISQVPQPTYVWKWLFKSDRDPALEWATFQGGDLRHNVPSSTVLNTLVIKQMFNIVMDAHTIPTTYDV